MSKFFTFDQWKASLRPELLALVNMPYAESGAEADRLAALGFNVDYGTMVYKLDPLTVMRVRLSNGQLWWPAVGQDRPADEEMRKLPAPERSILTLVEDTDYPPFTPADPPPPPAPKDYFGVPNHLGFQAQGTIVDGVHILEEGHIALKDGAPYYYSRRPVLMAPSAWWVRESAWKDGSYK
jgi:hypothetical protein